MIIDKKYLTERFGVEPAAPETGARPLFQETKLRNSTQAQGLEESPESEQQEAKSRFEDTAEAAFAQIERWILIRDQSVKEVNTKLRQKGYSPESIEEAVQRALASNYLDDSRFADNLIRSRLRQGKGIAGIERELKAANIAPESIPGYPEEYLSEAPSQLDLALELLRRKPPRSKNRRQGAYAKLMRNGFTSAIAAQAAQTWAQESD